VFVRPVVVVEISCEVMSTILRTGFFLFLLITFFDGHSNFIIGLRHNNDNEFNETNVKNNNSKIENLFDINDLYDSKLCFNENKFFRFNF
jgi:hypothetical protein